jgi:hypothetical protein
MVRCCLEALLVLGIDRLAHVYGEAGVSPGEQPLDELLGDGVAIEEAGEDSLAEQTHQERGVPLGQGDEFAVVCGEAAVAGEEVEVGVPLQAVSGGGHRDDETGTQVESGRAADELERWPPPRPE